MEKKFTTSDFAAIKNVFQAFLVNAHYFAKIVTQFVRKNKNSIIKIALPLLVIFCGYYSCLVSKRNIVQSVDEIFFISDEIRSYYSDKPDYWRLDTSAAKNIISKKFIKDDKIVLSHGYNVLVGNGGMAETVLPTMQSFDIVLPNLNKAQCISFAEASINKEDSLKLNSITIANSQGEFIFEWGGTNPLPVAKYATKSMCVDRGNKVIWSIK